MKRHRKEQNLQQFPCSELLRLHRRSCYFATKAAGAYGSPAQEHDTKWVGYREEVAHTKCKGTQKTSNITLSISARDTAPSGPISLPSKFRIWSDLFPYTGTRHNEGGLPKGLAHKQFDDGMVDLQTKRKKVDHTHKSGRYRGLK